jgi:hypothetical protein
MNPPAIPGMEVHEDAVLGPMTTPGGATGGAGSANSAQTATDLVQVVGPLPPGVYTIESDVELRAVQGTAAKLVSGSPTASPLVPATALTPTALRQIGARIPPSPVEVKFVSKPNANYFAWVKKLGAADGADVRIHYRTGGVDDANGGIG